MVKYCTLRAKEDLKVPVSGKLYTAPFCRFYPANFRMRRHSGVSRKRTEGTDHFDELPGLST